jgi:hypothetical protein
MALVWIALVLGALAALGPYAVSAGAFAGALTATLLVHLIARTPAGITPLRLVLTGVAFLTADIGEELAPTGTDARGILAVTLVHFVDQPLVGSEVGQRFARSRTRHSLIASSLQTLRGRETAVPRRQG